MLCEPYFNKLLSIVNFMLYEFFRKKISTSFLWDESFEPITESRIPFPASEAQLSKGSISMQARYRSVLCSLG